MSMTIPQMIARESVGIEQLLAEYEQNASTIRTIRERCEQRGEQDPSDAEAGRVRQASDANFRLRGNPKVAKVLALRAEQTADEAADRQAGEVHPTGAAAPHQGSDRDHTAGASTRSRDVYTAERDRRGERSFFSDLFNAEQRGDIGARQRVDTWSCPSRA